MPAITVTFTPAPAHVRTARLVALATARRAGVDDDLLDEVRLAVGEACSRAVALNARCGEPVVMTISDDGDRFAVEVRDRGGMPPDGDGEGAAAPWPAEIEVPPGLPEVSELGLAVIRGLVDDFEITREADGSRVRLAWPVADAASAAGG